MDLLRIFHKLKNPKIKTPDGIVPLKKVFKSGEKDCIKINEKLECSLCQKIETKKGWVSASDLTHIDFILTYTGWEKISKIEKTKKQPVFDLTVEHPNHRYFANGVSIHNCSDALNTYGIFMQLAQVQNQDNVFLQQPVPMAIDHKLIDVLRNMYRTGFPVNIDYAINASKDIIFRLSLLEKKLYDFVGRLFDIRSPQQVSKILFEEFKIPALEGMVRGKPTKANPQGLYSTDADTLEALYLKHPDIPILEYIVQFRQLSLAFNNIFSKLIANSYVDALIPYARSQAQYSMTVIPTGRLSSSSNDGREGVIVKETKAGSVTYAYHKGSWSCDFNTQGMNKADKKTGDARRILSLPESANVSIESPYPKAIELELVKLVSQV